MVPWQIAVIGAAISAFIAFISYRNLQTRLKQEREELAINLLLKWVEFSQPETSSVERLIKELKDDQCKAIQDVTSLVVDKVHRELLLNIFELKFPDIEKNILDPNLDRFTIEGRHLLYMRYIAIRYLNMLESILTAWLTAAADREIIERQFAFVADVSFQSFALEKLRNQVGLDRFPSIVAFVAEQKKPGSILPPRKTKNLLW